MTPSTPPCNLAAAARREGREDWLAGVPAIIDRFEAEWSLAVGPAFQPGGMTAWVAPARDATGVDRVLKVAWRHPEAEREADGLRVWAGNGAVRLEQSAELDDAHVLLLERCVPGTSLSDVPEPRQDEVIASLLRRLWVAPPRGNRFVHLSAMCAQWADQFDRKQAHGEVALDPGLAREGIGLFRTLPLTAAREVLLATDLHAGNVLAAEREPWLAIDPKPHVGDPTYDIVQHLLNCPGRLATDPLALVARVAALVDVDRDRLHQWLFARCVQESPDWPALADVARRVTPG